MVWWTRSTHPLLWGRPGPRSGAAASARRGTAPAKQTLPAGFEAWNALREWTADLHARVGYEVGRGGRTVHPDAVAEIDVDGRRRWIYLEADRGTAELRRYGLKLRR